MRNAIYWVEIPALDFERAKKFYETIFDIETIPVPMPRGQYAIFPLDRDALGAGGAIVQGPGYQPSGDSKKGPIVYLDRGNEDLSKPLSKVEQAGGKILMTKNRNGDIESSFIAQF